MDERDRGQGSLSDKVKGSYRRVSVVMYVTLVIAAIAVFCGGLCAEAVFTRLHDSGSYCISYYGSQ